jgi:hypothetical protein
MRPKILLALIPISFALGSCQKEDLEAAKSFGTLAQNLATANTTISADIYGSCARSATWEALGTDGSRKNMEDQLDVCNSLYRPNAQNSEIAGSVLVNYVAAVGNLATESDSGFTAQFTTISDALGKININGITINENARTAAVQIADFITNLLVRDFRRRNLKVAIVCTDRDIQEYSASLSDFIDSSYVNYLLDREISQINENYGFYIGQVNRLLLELSDSKNNSNPQDFKTVQERQTLLEAEERAEIAKVIDRKKEGSAYVATIRFTAEFHGKLKRIFNDGQEELSSEQIQKCNEYRSNNESVSVQKIDKESDDSDREITVSELKQVKQAAKEYLDKVTPLLNQIQD